MNELIADIANAVTQATGTPFAPRDSRTAHGGDISQAFTLSDDTRTVFVKVQPAARQSMFETEAAGLAELARAGAVRVPEIISQGVAGRHSFLVLEHLSFGSRGDAAQFGRQLAAQHRVTVPRFGWKTDNWIGSTPQPNGWMDDWIAFWRTHRLGFQLDLAARNGYGGALQSDGERLLAHLDAFFDGYSPAPSLLHGDLWGGNHGYLADGEPVIFDPAIYHGDRECDLAMTELFGGYAHAFHAAYREAWPLDAGYATRKILYNLYHVLNHANMFGGGYVGQASRMIDQLLAELR